MQDPRTVHGGAAVGTTTAPPAEAEPELATKQLTQLQLTWVRFRRHKPAVVGVVMILFMIVIAALAGVPQLMPESPYNIFSYDPINNQNLAPSLHPHWYFMLGTDDGGHTMVSQIMWGARISLAVGFISSLLTSLVGLLVGSIAGYFGGWTDMLMMRVTDIFLTLPFLPMLILAADIFGQGHLWVIIGIFVVFTWPGVARLARASYLSLRTQEFTEAARAVGVSNMRIIFRHLLPNALRPVIVATTLNVASFIVVEAAIDFLGAGIKPPDASWGNILANAQTGFTNGNWWWGTFPGLFLVLSVLAVNFLGDGLGDALDVRSNL
jgi:peptide/nickel transport system permease protein